MSDFNYIIGRTSIVLQSEDEVYRFDLSKLKTKESISELIDMTKSGGFNEYEKEFTKKGEEIAQFVMLFLEDDIVTVRQLEV